MANDCTQHIHSNNSLTRSLITQLPVGAPALKPTSTFYSEAEGYTGTLVVSAEFFGGSPSNGPFFPQTYTESCSLCIQQLPPSWMQSDLYKPPLGAHVCTWLYNCSQLLVLDLSILVCSAGLLISRTSQFLGNFHLLHSQHVFFLAWCFLATFFFPFKLIGSYRTHSHRKSLYDTEVLHYKVQCIFYFFAINSKKQHINDMEVKRNSGSYYVHSSLMPNSAETRSIS